MATYYTRRFFKRDPVTGLETEEIEQRQIRITSAPRKPRTGTAPPKPPAPAAAPQRAPVTRPAMTSADDKPETETGGDNAEMD